MLRRNSMMLDLSDEHAIVDVADEKSSSPSSLSHTNNNALYDLSENYGPPRKKVKRMNNNHNHNHNHINNEKDNLNYLLINPKEEKIMIEIDLDSHLSAFECPICYEMLNDKIYQCSEGHLLCEACHKQIHTCPQCHKPLTNHNNHQDGGDVDGDGDGGIRNRALEELFKKIFLPHLDKRNKNAISPKIFLCIFHIFGCKYRSDVDSKEDTIYLHIQSCNYRPCRCMFDKNCTWIGLWNEFANHCVEYHHVSENSSIRVEQNLLHSTSSPPSIKKYTFHQIIKFPDILVHDIMKPLFNKQKKKSSQMNQEAYRQIHELDLSEKEKEKEIESKDDSKYLKNDINLLWATMYRFSDSACFLVLSRFIEMELNVIVRSLTIKKIENHENYIAETIIPYIRKYEQHLKHFWDKYRNHKNGIYDSSSSSCSSSSCSSSSSSLLISNRNIEKNHENDIQEYRSCMEGLLNLLQYCKNGLNEDGIEYITEGIYDIELRSDESSNNINGAVYHHGNLISSNKTKYVWPNVLYHMSSEIDLEKQRQEICKIPMGIIHKYWSLSQGFGIGTTERDISNPLHEKRGKGTVLKLYFTVKTNI